MKQKGSKIKFVNQIWEVLDNLRTLGIQPEKHHLLLFLLILKRKANLPIFTTKPTSNILLEIEQQVQVINNTALEECYFKVYKPLITGLGEHSLNLILAFFNPVDLPHSDDDFTETFDWLLYRLVEGKGRSGGEGILPEKLGEFIANLVEVEKDSVVYNPFAGFATFGIYINNEATYIGQEINLEIWAQGILRRIAYGNKIGQLLQGDSLNEWLSHTKFDLIISSPPFGKIRNFNKFYDSSIKSYDEFVIKTGIESLKPEGKLVILVPNSFLFNPGAYVALRKNLISKDLIEKIISLPAGILHNTGIQTSILILNRNKKEKKNITIVDGTKYEIKETRYIGLDYENLNSIIKEGRKAVGIKKISCEQVIQENYNLEVGRYFWKDDQVINNDRSLEPLSEILTEIKGAKLSDGLGLKLVSIKHLSNDSLDYELKIGEIEPENSPIRNAKQITESCLLVARIGNDLKPTYFKFKGQNIAVSNNVMVFRVDEDRVILDYLINEIFSPFVQKQLTVYRRGVAQKMIRKNDFLSIEISLPEVEEQKLKMQVVKETFFKAREKEISLQKEILGFKDETFREFASIKHTFRQYLNSLKSNVSGTSKFISKNKGIEITLNSVYSKNLNRTLGEHLASLEGTIDSMSHLLSTFEESKVRDGGEKKKFNLIDLIIESQNRFKNPDKFTFEKLYIDKASLTDFSGYYTRPIIILNKEDFFTLFSNIVSNALDHGFRNKKGNIIRTTLTNDFNLNMHVIEISNNGRPFSKGFAIDKLITRGEKTSDSKGSGMGGADIKAIINHYNGTLELENNPEDEFPVTYIIKFPFHIEITL